LILTTVGTHDKGFERLVAAMDELGAEVDETIIMQYGSARYEPKHTEGFRWTDAAHLDQLAQDARVIVSHAAAGSILMALRRNKPLVLVPRLPEFGEVIDDHQRQLARALAADGRATVVDFPTARSLRSAIDQAYEQRANTAGAGPLIGALRRQLDDWSAEVLKRPVSR